jgi:hypothetical protein
MQETENTEGTVKFKNMDFDTRGWSTEKVEKLCKKLKREGYKVNSFTDKCSSISTYESGSCKGFVLAEADINLLTTYEEYMGEEVKVSMREVVLTSNTVSIENVIYSQLYSIEGAMIKSIIYQVNGVYTYSPLGALSYTKERTFNSLQEVIKFCLGEGYKVYEFDNSEDLLRWLLEK